MTFAVILNAFTGLLSVLMAYQSRTQEAHKPVWAQASNCCVLPPQASRSVLGKRYLREPHQRSRPVAHYLHGPPEVNEKIATSAGLRGQKRAGEIDDLRASTHSCEHAEKEIGIHLVHFSPRTPNGQLGPGGTPTGVGKYVY